MGAAWAEGLTPLEEDAALRARYQAVREAMQWMYQENPTLAGAAAIAGWAELAARGGRLTGEQLAAVARTVAIGAQLRRRLGQGRYPHLRQLFDGVALPEELHAAIAAQLDEHGAVRDEATPKLYSLRRQIAALEEEIDQVLAQILHHPAWAPYLQEPVVTIRFGRKVVPVKAEYRSQVRGLVHDQSGSGQTVFVEPLEVVTRQNRLTYLGRQEAEEVERILDQLSAAVGRVRAELVQLERALAQMDGWLAIVRLGSEMQGHLIDFEGSELWLKDARHPLLERPVPISVRLTAQKRCLIITGPNTGGKTVALKTTGLLVAMARSGLMVPAREDSVIPPVRTVWADIGDEQSLEQNLSTFSSHLRRLIPLSRHAGPESLCLIDEIGAGTDPEEGQALAEALIERLVERRAWTVVTTHFGRLKLLAYSHPGIENGRVTFDRETLTPTYHLVIGQPGGSEAFQIAARLGLEPELVERARSLLHPQQLAFEEALAEIATVQGRLLEQEAELSAIRQELEAERERLEAERREFEAWRERARERAQSGWRREFERYRQEFEALLQAVRESEGKERARALEALRALYRRGQAGPSEWSQEGERPERRAVAPAVGDWVKAPGLTTPGQVVALSGRTATVELGGIRLKLAVDELAPASAPKPLRREGTSLGLARRQLMEAERDLRGMTVEEALEAVDKYLDDAVLAGLSVVRVIHGKGTGALRRAIAEALSRDPRVARWRLGGVGEGGDGVTVVYLEEPAEGGR